MVREWFHKAAGGVDGGESLSATTKKPLNRKKEKYINTSSTGCMTAIYNLFDIQHHQFRFYRPSFESESAIDDDQHSSFSFQGIEAPRNSLESPESAMKPATASASSSSEIQQTDFNIKEGKIQIETKRSRFTDDITSNSPATKTPSLVARLMGLDLLPEYSSPRSSSSLHRSRSLPATPGLSTPSRSSMDNDYHHRLSLQVEKENSNSRRRSEIPVNRQEHDRSNQFAKDIKNDTGEKASRRLGTDITNIMLPAGSNNRRDSNLELLKRKKSPVKKTVVTSKPTKRAESTPLSSSKKVRLLDIKSNLNNPTSNLRCLSIKEGKLKCRITPKFHRSPEMKQEIKLVRDEKIMRIVSERYDLRMKKMNHEEKVFAIASKKKSTALSNDHVLNVKNKKKLNALKKEMASSSPTAIRLSKKQVSLPSNLNLSYNSNVIQNLNPATVMTATTASGVSSDQFHSSSNPLHPSIFHQLEQLRQPTRPTNKLCEKMGSFPTTGGEVVERDIGKSMQWWLSLVFPGELEGIVVEIESEILGNLVHEIATEEMVAPAGSD